MVLVQKIIEMATPFVVPTFWALAVLVMIAASTQSSVGKKLLELVANIEPEESSNPSTQFSTPPRATPRVRGVLTIMGLR
jgi:hypothetical protein